MERRFVVVEGWAARAGRAAVGLLALLGLVALAPVPAGADAASSPGKVTAVRSAIGLTVDNGSLPKTVQLVKGKRKYLLVVSGVLSGFALTPWTDIGLGATVNGVDFEPFDANLSRVFQQCGSSPSGGHCTVSGTWFVDLDAMEAAHPGMFVNMPLSVTMNPQAFGGLLTGAKLSLTAMLVKK